MLRGSSCAKTTLALGNLATSAATRSKGKGATCSMVAIATSAAEAADPAPRALFERAFALSSRLPAGLLLWDVAGSKLHRAGGSGEV